MLGGLDEKVLLKKLVRYNFRPFIGDGKVVNQGKNRKSFYSEMVCCIFQPANATHLQIKIYTFAFFIIVTHFYHFQGFLNVYRSNLRCCYPWRGNAVGFAQRQVFLSHKEAKHNRFKCNPFYTFLGLLTSVWEYASFDRVFYLSIKFSSFLPKNERKRGKMC